MSKLSAFLPKFDSGEPSQMKRFLDLGEFSRAIEIADVSRSSERFSKRRTIEKILQLEVRIPNGQVINKSNSGTEAPRVLYLLTNSLPFTQSGYTQRSQNSLKALSRKGVAVRAVTRLAYPVLVGKLPKGRVQTVEGIEYSRMLSWQYPMSLQSRDDLAVQLLVDEGRKFRADLLHTTTDYKNAIVAARAAEILEIPWVYEVRGELENTWLSKRDEIDQELAERSEFYGMARSQEDSAMLSASHVIALSELSKRRIVERGISPERITVLPNAVDSEIIGRKFDREAIRSELELPEGQIFGAVTSVVDYEGLDGLIFAAQKIQDAHCLIVGEGDSRPQLESLARELGISQRVIFAGRKPPEEIWKWYAALDVFAVPRKGLEVTKNVTPIKTLIAQALGVPIVASDLPALREITGGHATYVEADNWSELARAIEESFGKVPGEDSISWVSDRTWQKNAELLLEMYRGC
ncbi:glycosyltransferase family 4 protein [Corynebacterium lubricantis]|uniref:glycosyltransferase family 4 protein n=1 Tax=Corynebacterium lubricantis TaxID=541095 RepID=UPI0014614A5B|nr:glycosyltransferase family 4 protein [Corynebacterium lubricantis]